MDNVDSGGSVEPQDLVGFHEKRTSWLESCGGGCCVVVGVVGWSEAESMTGNNDRITKGSMSEAV